MQQISNRAVTCDPMLNVCLLLRLGIAHVARGDKHVLLHCAADQQHRCKLPAVGCTHPRHVHSAADQQHHCKLPAVGCTHPRHVHVDIGPVIATWQVCTVP